MWRRMKGNWLRAAGIMLAFTAMISVCCLANEKSGDALMEKKQYHKAIKEYEKVHKDEPENGELLAKLARAYDKAEWYGQAVQYWEMYGKKFPDGTHAAEARKQAARARRWLGVHFYDMGDDLEKVERQLLKAVEWDPEYVDAYYWLGRILMEKGKFKEAVDALEKAGKLDPENKNVVWLLKETKGRLDQGDEAYAHYSEAYALYEDGTLDEALQQYELAVQANPQFTEAHAWIARIYMEQGQYSRALDKWRIVLQLDPANKRAAWFRDLAQRNLSNGQ